jgi:hypothetical protein
MEYLIRGQGHEAFLALDKAAVESVLVPRGWPAERAEGAGDLRYRVEDDTEVALSLTADGWRVVFTGPIPVERAEQLVDMVAGQIADATGEQTEWLDRP